MNENEVYETREEHLAFCKARALEYVEQGDLQQALESMSSDLQKHPETKNHPGIDLGIIMLVGGHLDSREKMKYFIEGFN